MIENTNDTHYRQGPYHWFDMILTQQFHSFVLCVAFALYALWFCGLSEHENEGNMYIARKVSKYGFFSGPYFTVLGLNTGKYRPEKTPYLNTFDAVVSSTYH